MDTVQWILMAGPPQGQRLRSVIPGRKTLSDSFLCIQLKKKTEMERGRQRENAFECTSMGEGWLPHGPRSSKCLILSVSRTFQTESEPGMRMNLFRWLPIFQSPSNAAPDPGTSRTPQQGLRSGPSTAPQLTQVILSTQGQRESTRHYNEKVLSLQTCTGGLVEPGPQSQVNL